MKELIKQILSKWGCHHDWEVHNQMKVESDLGGYYWRETLICNKCGKIKRIKL